MNILKPNCFALFLFITASFAHGQEIINPGFEEGTFGEIMDHGWIWTISSETVEGEFSYDSTTALEGSRSLKVHTVEKEGQDMIPPNSRIQMTPASYVYFQAGSSSSFSFYARAGVSGKEIRVKFHSAVTAEIIEVISLSDQWERYTVSRDIPVSGDYYLLFQFAQDEGTFWLDSIGYKSNESATSNLTPELFFVAPGGDDGGAGNMGDPFRTIQHAVNRLGAGDTLYLREGSYHEEVLCSGLSGAEGAEIVILPYGNEKVILDGTIPIESDWEQHNGSIFKTKAPVHIWQLFVDERMQITARWPNWTKGHPCDPFPAREDQPWEPEDGTWWDREGTWARWVEPEIGEMDSIYTDPAYKNLAATGISFEGGSIVFNISEHTESQPVNHHKAGSNVIHYNRNPDIGDEKGWFFLEHLEALDRTEEFFYTPEDSMIYLWADDGQNPTGRQIRAKSHTYAFSFSASEYIKIQGLQFYATTVHSANGHHITLQDSHFSYPSFFARNLGNHWNNGAAHPGQTQLIGDSKGTWYTVENCVFEYMEGQALDLFKGHGNKVENNLFHHVDFTGVGQFGIEMRNNTSAVFRRNTFHTSGISAALKHGKHLSELNYFKWFGYLQDDGAAFQFASPSLAGAERSYNWFLYYPKYGARWDGKPAGILGLNHHNVGYYVNGGMQIKGDNNDTHNNTCLNNNPIGRNDILIVSDAEFGGNDNSRTWNNLADHMSGHRWLSVNSYPVPGDHSHNFNGILLNQDADQQLMDPFNLDFRPRPMAQIIDAGKEISVNNGVINREVTRDFLDAAPDIGAYEFGDTLYWIPGYKAALASMPIPADGGTSSYEFVDLIWLEAYKALASEVYFGTDEAELEAADPSSESFSGRQWSNIFSPGPLEAGQSYFWRIDAVMEDSVRRGKVWSFTAGVDSNPPTFRVDYEVFASRNDSVIPLDAALVRLNDRQTNTNAEGRAGMSMIQAAVYKLEITSDEYAASHRTISVHSDTTIRDTLFYDPIIPSYTLSLNVSNRSTGEAINRVVVTSGEQLKISNGAGAVKFAAIPAGKLHFSLEHADYFSLKDSCMVLADTSKDIVLTARYASVRFRVEDESNPLSSALTTLDGSARSTNSEGLAFYQHVPAREAYIYLVEKDLFQTVEDSLFLEVDTTVTVRMLAANSANSSWTDLMKIYPNPTDNEVRISTTENRALIRIISPGGRLLKSGWIFKGTNSLDISDLPEGACYIQVQDVNCSHYKKLMIIR